MKAQELRIGNKFECMGMIQTVFEICDNTDRGKIKQNGYEHIIRCIENGNQYKPIEINPIPLTEEWLLKFGFEKVSSNYEKGWLLLWGNIKTGTIDFVLNEPHSGKRHITALKYVHSFQNLYFALTGEELIIK